MINDTVFNALPRPQLEFDLREEGLATMISLGDDLGMIWVFC